MELGEFLLPFGAMGPILYPDNVMGARIGRAY